MKLLELYHRINRPKLFQLSYNYLYPHRSFVNLLLFSPKRISFLRFELYAYLLSVFESRILHYLLIFLLLYRLYNIFIPLLGFSSSYRFIYHLISFLFSYLCCYLERLYQYFRYPFSYFFVGRFSCKVRYSYIHLSLNLHELFRNLFR